MMLAADPRYGQSIVEMAIVPDVHIEDGNQRAVGQAVFTMGQEHEIEHFASEPHWNKQVIIDPMPFNSHEVLMGRAPSVELDNQPAQ